MCSPTYNELVYSGYMHPTLGSTKSFEVSIRPGKWKGAYTCDMASPFFARLRMRAGLDSEGVSSAWQP